MDHDLEDNRSKTCNEAHDHSNKTQPDMVTEFCFLKIHGLWLSYTLENGEVPISKKLELLLGFCFESFLFKEVYFSVASVMSRDDFDLPLSHPFHAEANSFWHELPKVFNRHFGKNFMLVVEFVYEAEPD